MTQVSYLLVELNQIPFAKNQKEVTEKKTEMTKNKETTKKETKNIQKEVAPVTQASSITKGLSAKLDSAMGELKEQNPMSSWKNLFLGVSVVMLVILSSLVYFNKLAANAIVEDKTKEIEISKPSTTLKPKNEKTLTKKDDVYTNVLEGEGLWNVAERVCKDGEKYVILAQANGLYPESEVVLGQKLLVKCD